MFTRSKKSRKKMVAKPAAIKIIKPEQSEKEEVLDLSKAKISIIKPESGLKIMVEENEGEDE